MKERYCYQGVENIACLEVEAAITEHPSVLKHLSLEFLMKDLEELLTVVSCERSND